MGNFFVHSVVGGMLSAENDFENQFQNLTISERIGQLIDLRVSPTKQNLEAILNTIREYNIGSITIAGGEPAAAATLIHRLKGLSQVPVFISVEQRQLSNLPFGQRSVIPLSTTFIAAGDLSLYNRGINRLAELLYEVSVNGVVYSPAGLTVKDNALEWNGEASAADKSFTDGFSGILAGRNLATSIPVRFRFSDSFGFSPRNLNADEFVTSVADQARLSLINQSLTVLNIVDFPAFPENEALLFQKKVMSPLLWKEWQFSGIVAADLDKISGARLTQPKMSDVRALLKGGVDKIIVSVDPGLVQNAIFEGINSRYFRQNEISDKVKRILSLKSGVAWNTDSTEVSQVDISKFQSDNTLREVAYRVYSAASEIQELSSPFLPIDTILHKSFASLTIGQSSRSIFSETLEQYTPVVHFNIPGLTLDRDRLDDLGKRLSNFDYVIVGLFTNDLLAFDQAIIQFLINLKAYSNVVVVFFGNEKPAISDFKEMEHRVLMREDCDFTQQIAPQLLFGANGFRNSRQRLGYSLPEIQGMDASVLAKIDMIAKEAIEMGATPGMQVLVARHGAVIMEKAYGYTTYDSLTRVDKGTIYDLASVTKVLSTTAAVMNLYETGAVSLDSTLGDYLPQLEGTNKSNLRIRDILAHRSGLRAFYPFWKFTARNEDLWNYYYRPYPNEAENNTVVTGMYATPIVADSLWRWTVETKLRTRRNSREPYGYKYSDLGFYLLQHVIERVTNTTLDKFMDSLVYRPMGMATLGYNPLCKVDQSMIAPTELDMEFRHMLLCGNVHDQLAAMTGGVGGQAGLFSNAHDAAKFMQMMLQGGTYGGQTYFSKETIDLFTKTAGKESRRGLGWDKPETSRGEHPASRYASFASYGHTGFTGTIVWADPTFDLVFVFLSNRVNPDPENTKLTTFNIRKRIQDLVYESIWSFEKQMP